MGPKRAQKWDQNGPRNGPKTGPKMAPGIAATKADPGNVPKTDAGILHGRVIALRARETYKNHFECPVMFDGNSSRGAVSRSFLCRNIHTYPFWIHGNPEIHEDPLVYIHSKWMDFLDFRKMQGGAWDMTARSAGRAVISIPTPLDS